MNQASLITRHEQLEREARDHKARLRTHRKALAQVRAEQAAIERQCRAHGIAIEHVKGGGTIHGRTEQEAAS